MSRMIARGLIGGFTALVVLVAGWFGGMLVASDGSLTFVWRNAIYRQSGIKDYEHFPERVIQNEPPGFNFKVSLQPALFETIVYTDTASGRRAEAPFDQFLKDTGTTSFIVIRDDAILYEKYFNGYQRDSIVTSFSTAKSWVSALMGIAIAEGRIGSVDDAVIEYVPELKGRGLDWLTIRHLLTMSSGIKYVEADRLPFLLGPLSDDSKTYYYPDLRKIALSVQPGDEPLGEYFHYNNYHLLIEGLILERVTDMHVAAYLQNRLWRPMGMEFPASWSLDSTESGFEKMESGINGRAIDFAKLGRLYLNQGNWNGKQLVPATWVTQSTTRDPFDHRTWFWGGVYKTATTSFYKYHWWGLGNDGLGSDDFAAEGHLGQLVYVWPEKHVVMVRFGDERGPAVQWHRVLRDIAATLPG